MENRIRKFGDASKVVAGGPGSAGAWFDSATDVFKVNPGSAGSADVRTFTDDAVAQAVTDSSGDGAITFSGSSPIEIKTISKGSAAALTLAAPVAADNGKQLIITSKSAFAHVITATDLLADGVTGGAKDTATFGAFKGASLHLVAVDLLWHVVSKNVVTIAAV